MSAHWLDGIPNLICSLFVNVGARKSVLSDPSQIYILHVSGIYINHRTTEMAHSLKSVISEWLQIANWMRMCLDLMCHVPRSFLQCLRWWCSFMDLEHYFVKSDCWVFPCIFIQSFKRAKKSANCVNVCCQLDAVLKPCKWRKICKWVDWAFDGCGVKMMLYWCTCTTCQMYNYWKTWLAHTFLLADDHV